MSLSPTARQRVLFSFLCFVWGTTWLAMKVGIATLPPGIFAGSRWTVAGLILLAVRKAKGEPIRVTPRLTGRLVVVAILMVTLNQVIQPAAKPDARGGDNHGQEGGQGGADQAKGQGKGHSPEQRHEQVTPQIIGAGPAVDFSQQDQLGIHR